MRFSKLHISIFPRKGNMYILQYTCTYLFKNYYLFFQVGKLILVMLANIQKMDLFVSKSVQMVNTMLMGSAYPATKIAQEVVKGLKIPLVPQVAILAKKSLLMPILMLINVCLLNKIARMGFIWIGFLDRPLLPMKCWIILKWKEKLFADPVTHCAKGVQPMDFIKKFVWNVIVCNNKTSALKNAQQIITL